MGMLVSILRPAPGRLPLNKPVNPVVEIGALVVLEGLRLPPKEFTEMPNDSTEKFSSSSRISSSSTTSKSSSTLSSKSSSAESTKGLGVVVVVVRAVGRPGRRPLMMLATAAELASAD
jgi:hypothetical protein